jgi:hypothetical protein
MSFTAMASFDHLFILPRMNFVPVSLWLKIDRERSLGIYPCGGHMVAAYTLALFPISWVYLQAET